MSPENHRNLSDSAFVEQFESLQLSAEDFTHEAHLRLAFLLLRDHGLEGGLNLVQDQLYEFVCHVGAHHKYHETLTVAATKAVWHFMQKGDFQGFSTFLEANPRLKTNFKDIIAQHYSFDVFHHPVARMKYLEPDLVEFG